ncbi:MAG: hypothetical protein ACLGJB_03680 [Blastocatellia bacterium]
MANTISTKTYRDKYRRAALEKLLRNALVAEKICEVDRSDAKTIQTPYSSQPTTTVQALAGTYSTADFTTTDDTLTVNNEFIVAEHIKDFESVLTNFDLFAARVDEMNYSVATAIDRFVLNNLLEDGTGTYSTPAGGFTTAANINVIMSNLISKVAGYSESYKGLFLVIENTDIPGFVQAQATNGFSFADAALNNGWMTSYMGVDIYVVRSSTFADETLGTTTYTNAGHRCFGVKGVATYAAPRGIQYDEKSVSGKTGKEVVVWGYIGFKLWTPKAGLIIDITIV